MDSDLSDADSVGDLSFEAESPLAPPAELLERLPSCDWLLQGDRRQIFFPPLEAPGRPQEQRCWSPFLEHGVPVVTEEVAREALLNFVNSKCCYGSAAATDLIIQELRQQTLCRYRLETFSESRISEWTFQPFTNHSVDGPQRGTSPRLWDIEVQVPPMFQEDTRKFQVPHSSLVKECHRCHGRGRYRCSGCHGASTVRCPSCSGAKRKAKPARRCPMCSGSGRQRCSTCSGRGNKTCATCKGEKKLLHFIQLVIVWKNSLFEFVSEHQLDCPGELLAKAKGETLFKDENTMVYPIIDFPLREISLASQRAIAEHNATLASRARVLQQLDVLIYKVGAVGLRRSCSETKICVARPSSWSPSRRFATRTEERLLSTTSTALTTECTWWTTPRGTAVAAPSSDTAQPRPDPTAHICRGGQTRSLSSLTVGCSGQPHTNPAVSFQRIQLLCQAPSHSEALLVESILCLTYKNSSTHVPLGEIT
ncbi:protein SSUH2 homolog isoform X3 [Camelus ferus]|uniref:Protein SSUH2 homolog isoform X3 n=1 Tax=Camelus ferus TaxID=419612 RepID=A0A8B8R9W2_CAMFR|nr:protein SSUH2 homolog isoform X3 [Camelus ferus]